MPHEFGKSQVADFAVGIGSVRMAVAVQHELLAGLQFNPCPLPNTFHALDQPVLRVGTPPTIQEHMSLRPPDLGRRRHCFASDASACVARVFAFYCTQGSIFVKGK